MPERKVHSASLAAGLAALSFIVPAHGLAAECVGKSVAQCADLLAQRVDELLTANADLSKRVADRETADEALKTQIDGLDAKFKNLSASLGSGRILGMLEVKDGKVVLSSD